MTAVASEKGWIPKAMSLAYRSATLYSAIKTAKILASIAQEASYFLNLRLLSRIPCTRKYRYHDCDEKMIWKANSTGLYVLIHGLNGHPSIWNGHIAELEKLHHADLFVPSVPHAGNCTLEEAAFPILNQLLDYIQKHPGNPICLIGVSNGARLALWLEVQLRKKAKTTAIKISNIAGLHLGSSRMNFLASSRLAQRLVGYTPQIVSELTLNSQKAKHLMKAVREPFEGKRDYEFFALMEDFHVPETESSLPFLGKREKHHLVSGYTHIGLLGSVRKKQLESCKAWMRRPIVFRGTCPTD